MAVMAEKRDPDASTPPTDARVEGEAEKAPEPEKAPEGGPAEDDGSIPEEELEDEKCGFCKFMRKSCT